MMRDASTPLAIELVMPVEGPGASDRGCANLLRRGVLRRAGAVHAGLADDMHTDPGEQGRNWTVSGLSQGPDGHTVRVTGFGHDAVAALLVALVPGAPLVPSHWALAAHDRWRGRRLFDDAPVGADDSPQILPVRLLAPTVFSGIRSQDLDPEVTARRLVERWRRRIIEHAPESRLAAACREPGVEAAIDDLLVVTSGVALRRVRHPRARTWVMASSGVAQVIVPAGAHGATCAAIVEAGRFLGAGRYVSQGFGQVASPSAPLRSAREPVGSSAAGSPTFVTS